jgi:predicted transposase YbfD/YdcC
MPRTQNSGQAHISSHGISTAQFNQQVRQHWSIENGCHWTLDVTFREDLCRIRAGHGVENTLPSSGV